MKTLIYFWAFQNEQFKKLTGYDHHQEIPFEDTFKASKEIFDKGLNVMVYHSTNGAILYVDDKRFTQR